MNKFFGNSFNNLLLTKTFFYQKPSWGNVLVVRNPTKVFLLRNCHSGNDNQNYAKIRRLKRIFSTILFGSTLAAAFYVKRERQRKLEATFQDCELLQLDKTHYVKPNMFYRFKGFVLPDFVIKQMKEIDNFQVKENDIFVVSFPKTGTTWVQEIVYLLASHMDFETANQIGIETRFPYLEFIYPGLKHVEKMEEPRLIKSHLPISLLPQQVESKKPKIIYVMRNPKDTLVSYYYFMRSLTATSYSGSFEDFFTSFLNDKIPYGPLDKHFVEFWNQRDQDNLLFIMYEDLHKDLTGSILKIATFLGINISQEEINRIKNHCGFSEMAANDSVNYSYWEDLGIRKKNAEPFMRKGVVGDWKNYFTPEMNSKMNLWIDDNITPSGLQFRYSMTDN